MTCQGVVHSLHLWEDLLCPFIRVVARVVQSERQPGFVSDGLVAADLREVVGEDATDGITVRRLHLVERERRVKPGISDVLLDGLSDVGVDRRLRPLKVEDHRDNQVHQQDAAIFEDAV